MKRLVLMLTACGLTVSTASAQLGQPQPGEGPSVAHAIPLSYVGGSGRISIGIDSEGNSTGEALGVFDNTGEHAWIGQLWWANGGAGGVQLGYNWLWGGMSLREAREHPERVTVARTMIAVDQNPFKDRKATFGFGIERPNYFIDAYLSTAASGSRAAGSRSTAVETMLSGADDMGAYTQLQTVTTSDGFVTRAYDKGIGVRAGHFSDLLALRLTGGMDYQYGRGGAKVFTVSAGADKFLGTRGWSMSGLVEHDQASGDPLHGSTSDTRASLFLRYEFGGRSFVPTSELTSPAWISRALVNSPNNHPRTVQTYNRRTTRTVTTRVDPKHYTNYNPVAQPDSFSVVSDSSGNMLNVLANDSDADGDTLMIVSVSGAAHGNAVIVGGQISYTPTAGYTGSDQISYTVSDGRGGTASGSISVTVTPRANSAPIARDDVASTAAGTAVTVNVLANDSDPDGDTLSVTAHTQAANGTVVANGNLLSYTPNSGYSGGDQFTYTVSDGHGNTAVASVRVTVRPPLNRPPVANNDAANVASGGTVAVTVLANDYDPDGDPITLVSVTQGTHGIATILPNQTIQYTWTDTSVGSGIDRFTYTIQDDRGHSDTATVTITAVLPFNQPPVAVNDSASLTYTGTGTPTFVDVNVLANDSDPDGDPLTVTAVTQGASGTVLIMPGNLVRYTGTLPIGAVDTFTYTISDGNGGTATATVTITGVAPLNNPPIANNDAANLPFSSVGLPTSVDIDVRQNDSDPDGDPLTVTAVTQGALGTVLIMPNQQVRYTGTLPIGAVDTFTYTISDGNGGTATAAVTITGVAPLNQPPIANNDTATLFAVGAGGVAAIDVRANDSDPDGDPLTVTSFTQGTYGTVSLDGNQIIQYATTTLPAGTLDTFTYTISDGQGGTATATVTVGW
ncbi:Ig-like domain-containing protein [Dokdonella sp.]|uniref:Ig-like domain-containing protein n=1 Tax=Dokdonella sp. TaxID=2291710 RepID=UPI0025C1C78E|nr:Ig-like domain-containing protein [Dokdonella sp.]MBX3689110.1 tandem-95 repeat protein [Dokdonella sp.]